MSYQVQFVCIGLIILHCITAGLSNVEDNRIMERTSEKILNSTTAAPNNSTPTKIGTSTKPTSHPFTTTVQPGVLRPPNFTTGSFFTSYAAVQGVYSMSKRTKKLRMHMKYEKMGDLKIYSECVRFVNHLFPVGFCLAITTVAIAYGAVSSLESSSCLKPTIPDLLTVNPVLPLD